MHHEYAEDKIRRKEYTPGTENDEQCTKLTINYHLKRKGSSREISVQFYRKHLL